MYRIFLYKQIGSSSKGFGPLVIASSGNFVLISIYIMITKKNVSLQNFRIFQNEEKLIMNFKISKTKVTIF
jgi:hypothetical protein